MKIIDTDYRKVRSSGKSLILNLTKIFNKIDVKEGDNLKIDILDNKTLHLTKAD